MSIKNNIEVLPQHQDDDQDPKDRDVAEDRGSQILSMDALLDALLDRPLREVFAQPGTTHIVSTEQFGKITQQLPNNKVNSVKFTKRDHFRRTTVSSSDGRHAKIKDYEHDIAFLREHEHLTQKEVAETLGISQSSVSRLEHKNKKKK